MAMKVYYEIYLVLFGEILNKFPYVINRIMIFSVRIMPISIKVNSKEITSIVSMNYSIWIDHRDYDEVISHSEIFCFLRGA